MMHIAMSTRLLAPNRGQEGRACLSKRRPHISLYPGVCCFVECWLSVSASSEPKPPTASQRRSRVDCASAASAERGGAATADCSPSPGKLKPVVKTSTSSRRRGAAMAEPPHLHGPRLRPHLGIIENTPGAEGQLSRRLVIGGCGCVGGPTPLMRERAGLLMLRISPIYHTCPAF